jgi:hypothetical protein
MSNLEVYLPTVDGSEYSIHEAGESCKLAIHTLFTDDFAAPPIYMCIKIKTDSGKVVEIKIPYDHKDTALAYINGEKV